MTFLRTCVLLSWYFVANSSNVSKVDGFVIIADRRSQRAPHQFNSKTRCNNWIVDLWEEVIEFSTYGPSERRMLKAKREAAKAAKEEMAAVNGDFVVADRSTMKSNGSYDVSVSAFQQAKRKVKGEEIQSSKVTSSSDDIDVSSLSLESFQATVAAKQGIRTAVMTMEEEEDTPLDFDGYMMRDLLLTKWGVPLDIDFQRGYSQQSVYCTIMPVAFGSKRCRHTNELEYLMHLQAVVEILHQYKNLDAFLYFIQSTSKVPKPGVESVPFRLELDEDQLQKILGTSI